MNPDLVVRDDEGKPYTVRYEAVNAMSLNEFLKEHSKVEDLETAVVQLRAAAAQEKELQGTVAKLQSALEKQSEQLQKVTEQVETSWAAGARLAAKDSRN